MNQHTHEQRLQQALRRWDEAKQSRWQALQSLNAALDRGNQADVRWYRNALNLAIEREESAFQELAMIKAPGS